MQLMPGPVSAFADERGDGGRAVWCILGTGSFMKILNPDFFLQLVSPLFFSLCFPPGFSKICLKIPTLNQGKGFDFPCEDRTLKRKCPWGHWGGSSGD